jgi:hypothetical protein
MRRTQQGARDTEMYLVPSAEHSEGNTQPPGLRFRALLTYGASEMELALV